MHLNQKYVSKTWGEKSFSESTISLVLFDAYKGKLYMYVLINNGHSKIDLSKTPMLFLIINIPSESMIHVFNQNAKKNTKFRK